MKQLGSAFVPILVSFILIPFSIQNTVSQTPSRNWDLVKDSLMNDLGILMPEMPDSFLSTEQFLERGKCDPVFIRLAHRDVCTVIKDSVIVKRFRFIDVRVGVPTKVLLVVAYNYSFGNVPATCDLWVNEGFWDGGEPDDNFTEVIKDNPCGRGENVDKFNQLLKVLVLRE